MISRKKKPKNIHINNPIIHYSHYYVGTPSRFHEKKNSTKKIGSHVKKLLNPKKNQKKRNKKLV